VKLHNFANEDILISYKVNYMHGLPEHKKPIYSIRMNLLRDGIFFQKTRKHNFYLYIEYKKIEKIEIVKGVGTRYGNIADLAGKQIEITYQNDVQHQMCIRFEMATAKLIGWADVKACQELMSFIKNSGIADKFIQPATHVQTPDILTQIEKLGELHKSGVLTDEEFEAKKAELLGRL